MVQIDIPVQAPLQEALDGLACADLRLPQAKSLEIHLPTGSGSLKAFTDLSKGIPTDCTMTFNLMLQLAPMLASMECILKILKLLEPLAAVVTGLTKMPPKPPAEAIAKLPGAVADLAPCFGIFAALPVFGKDLLCLVRAILMCLLQQFKSLRNLMSGLQLRLEAADGNEDLMAALQCSQENAAASAANLTQAIEPISGILQLMSPVLGMAGLPSISLQTPGAPPEDLAALDAIVNTLQAVVDAIDDATGGICAD